MFQCQFLKALIVSERIEHRVEPELRRFSSVKKLRGLIPVYRTRHAGPNFGSQDRHAAGLRAGQL